MHLHLVICIPDIDESEGNPCHNRATCETGIID